MNDSQRDITNIVLDGDDYIIGNERCRADFNEVLDAAERQQGRSLWDGERERLRTKFETLERTR